MSDVEEDALPRLLFPTLSTVASPQKSNYKYRKQKVISSGQYHVQQFSKRNRRKRSLKLPSNNSIPLQSEIEHRITDKEIIDQICSSNGFTLAYAKKHGREIENLEIIFASFDTLKISPRIDQLFSHLTNLEIIGLKNLTEIPDLSLPLLETLWVVECGITGSIEINFAESFPELKKLYLYSNKITKFSCQLPISLTELSLAENCLNQFPQAVKFCHNLEILNVAMNCIPDLSFLQFANLEYLKYIELTGNKISSPFQLTYLAQHLPALENLGLANHVYYRSNPLCRLSAYSILVLSYFSGHNNLKQLDNLPICWDSTKEYLKKLISEKRKFYFMISRHIIGQIYKERKILDEWFESFNNFYRMNRGVLYEGLAKVKRAYFRSGAIVPMDKKVSNIENQERIWKKAIDESEKDFQKILNCYRQAKESLSTYFFDQMTMLNLEFRLIGNIQFQCVDDNKEINNKMIDFLSKNWNNEKNFTDSFVLKKLTFIQSKIYESEINVELEKTEEDIDEKFWFLKSSSHWERYCDAQWRIWLKRFS